MPHHQMSELCKLEEDHQNQRENQDPVAVQVFEAEEEKGEAMSLSSCVSSLSGLFPVSLEEVSAAQTASPPQSPQVACPSPPARAAPPCSQPKDEGSSCPDEEGPSTTKGSEDAESLLRDALHLKKVDLVGFLLLKYRARELTTKAEMLSRVIKEYQDHFNVIFSAASECMQLVFGLYVKEVDPIDQSYVPITTLGLTYDGMVKDGHIFPNTGLLVTVLWVIATEGDCAPEEAVWEALHVRGLYDGKEHWIYGDPRELITKVWVCEQYLVYHQVPNSDPARYEFLWGPRAHTETTELIVLDFLLRICRRDPSSVSFPSEEGVSDEEEV